MFNVIPNSSNMRRFYKVPVAQYFTLVTLTSKFKKHHQKWSDLFLFIKRNLGVLGTRVISLQKMETKEES